MSVADELEGSYVGEDRIRLTLDEATSDPGAFQDVIVNVDYDDTLPEGVVPPLELIIRPPTAENFQRRIFKRAPKVITFRPKEGGSHLVRLRECYHNLWTGILVVEVAGDRIQAG